MRYEVREGKFGKYFYDVEEGKELGLKEIENKLNGLVSEKSESTQTYLVGDIFKSKDGRFNILARVDTDTINLIDLEDGNRWYNNLKVSNIKNITTEEFNELINTKYHGEDYFKKVSRSEVFKC